MQIGKLVLPQYLLNSFTSSQTQGWVFGIQQGMEGDKKSLASCNFLVSEQRMLAKRAYYAPGNYSVLLNTLNQPF